MASVFVALRSRFCALCAPPTRGWCWSPDFLWRRAADLTRRSPKLNRVMNRFDASSVSVPPPPPPLRSPPFLVISLLAVGVGDGGADVIWMAFAAAGAEA